MIVWLAPAALAALVATAAPVVVHLLLRHRAARLTIPTVRFVPAVVPSAIRMRRPSDPGLLVVRVAIVTLAALATAGPLFVTDGRRAAWNERTARAVVIDTRGATDSPEFTAALRAEQIGAHAYREIETRELAAELRRSANWLKQAPPARREIVVISPFVHGTLAEGDLASIQPDAGLRFVRSPPRSAPTSFRASILTAEGRRQMEVTLAGDATSVGYEATGPVSFDGVSVLARSEDAGAIAGLHRVIARAGVAAPRPDRPVIVRLRGGAAFGPEAPPQPGASAAALRLAADPAVAGLPVEVSASANELRVSADVPAASMEAATVARAAIEASVEPPQQAIHETIAIPTDVLKGWSREPASLSADAWRQSDDSDGRWFWLAALVLLGLESWIRKRAPRQAEAMADAA
jgi:hypothetical protein